MTTAVPLSCMKLQYIRSHLSGSFVTGLWQVERLGAEGRSRFQLRSRVSFGAVQRLKMWTSLSASRWICLLTLAVVMLFSASQVDSYVPIVGLPCCRNVSSRRIERIKACYEQKPREGCNHHAFLIITKRNKQWCVNPAAAWLKDKIEKGKLSCPPDLALNRVRQVDVAL